jgi:hypothetical protein
MFHSPRFFYRRNYSVKGIPRKRVLVEHPFAIIKRVLHFSHTLVTPSRRGRVKFMFSCFAYNLFALNIIKV